MNPTRWFSLRRRLTGLMLGGIAAFWLVTLVFSYFDAHHEVDELFDAQLAQAAHSLLAVAGQGEGESAQPKDIAHRYQQRLMFQIWRGDGSLALRSPNAPSSALTPVEGFSEIDDASGHWRYYSEWDGTRRYQVQVAENHAVRDDHIRNIALRLLVPAAFGLPLLGVWAWIATRRGLSPLDAVASQIGARDPKRLQPVAPEAAPEEIRPLLDALNGLFDRVEHALDTERRFTADAAHELRTPLAALAVQARVALHAQSEGERRRAVEQFASGTARAARLVDQLLTLARLDPDQPVPAERVRLDRLAEEACAAHGSEALAKNIDLGLEATPAEVRGSPDLLRILLRNLIDNAIRYTPPGGRVTVSVDSRGEEVRLRIVDNGIGIPPAERERVFHRFHRLAGQDTEGSGLGLSIVGRIAELHRAEIALGEGEDGRGLEVAVVFPGNPQD